MPIRKLLVLIVFQRFLNCFWILGDARFSFLDEDHALHSYYLEKLSLYRQLHAEKEAQVDVDVEPAQEMTDVEDDVRDSRSKRSEADEEIVKIERRKKAALFLHQIKVAKSLGNYLQTRGRVKSPKKA